MLKIAISYRRSDSQDITGRIFDRLALHYGKDMVFRDIDNIRPGIDFRKQIAEALRTTNVLLVVVGPRWLGRVEGEPARIDNEADPVRIEVETALGRDIPVIPVLVGGCAMPTTGQLPVGLKDFAYRHAVTIDGGRDFDHHISGLVRAPDDLLGSLAAEAAAAAQEKAAAESSAAAQMGAPGASPVVEKTTDRVDPPPSQPRQSLLAPAQALTLQRFGFIAILAVAVAAVVAVLLREPRAPEVASAPSPSPKATQSEPTPTPVAPSPSVMATQSEPTPTISAPPVPSPSPEATQSAASPSPSPVAPSPTPTKETAAADLPPPVVPPFPVRLGDSYDKVRSALHVGDTAKPYDTGSGSPGTVLELDARGISIFFDSSKNTYAINFHPPFAGTVWGIRLGDSRESIKKRFGEPATPSSSDTRFYYYGKIVVDFDFTGKVAALIL